MRDKRVEDLPLWAAVRDVVHRIAPYRERESAVPPHIGGGTAPAAHWRHRTSTDIDIDSRAAAH